MSNPVACLSGTGLPIMARKGVVRVMLNETIKNARKAKGMSQEEMAVQLNVVRQTVSKWEKGLSVPDADDLIRISALLDVSVNDLLGLSRPNDAAEDLAGELARVNEQLAAKKQEENLYRQANKKRGLILLLSFAALLIALRVENQLVSIFLVGGLYPDGARHFVPEPRPADAGHNGGHEDRHTESGHDIQFCDPGACPCGRRSGPGRRDRAGRNRG